MGIKYYPVFAGLAMSVDQGCDPLPEKIEYFQGNVARLAKAELYHCLMVKRIGKILIKMKIRRSLRNVRNACDHII